MIFFGLLATVSEFDVADEQDVRNKQEAIATDTNVNVFIVITQRCKLPLVYRTISKIIFQLVENLHFN